MPARLAASMTRVPGGASTGFPSMVSFTKSAMPPCPTSSYQNRAPFIRAWTSVQVRFELIPKLLYEGNRRHGRSVAQRTERPTKHILRQIRDQVDVAPRSPAFMETDQQLPQPGRPLAPGDAPAAALVRVESHDAQQSFHHAGVLVHDHHSAGPEHALGFGQ